MARGLKKVEDNSTEIEETTEETTEEVVEETSKKPIEEKAIKVELVTIKTNRNHICTIGGETYHFQRGESIEVPENVKDILANAGMLLPL